jgi:hypothetical protein
VLTNVFPDLEPITESAERCRLCLNDSVASNGETWFLAQVFAQAAARGLRGIVTFADPVPRLVAGRDLFPGHIGTIYQAKGAEYLGRSTPRTLTVLPDGQILSARAAQKVRAGEPSSSTRRHHHVETRLVALGARPRRGATTGAAWLNQALDDLAAVRLRHPGNHRYAFRLGIGRRARSQVRIAGPGRPSPKPAAPTSEE